MAHQSDLIAADIHAYLKTQEEKSMLRFITCGSVDDGKSTLIGRLLWDSKMIFEDQLAALEADSKRVGTQGGAIDYALLMDGLQAEREQGITIDVAYRFFSTDKRKFIVADTPGHEQYTRNMVTGASTAQVAVILVDARKGILTQTRRHSYLVSLVGIRHVVLAINKMDLLDYSAARFHAIRKEYEAFAKELGFADITAIPISALQGDNVLEPSARTLWHSGPTLMNYLENVQVDDETIDKPFRLPVQWVTRPNLDFRGFAGTIASGRIRPGDEVVVPSSGRSSIVKLIVTMDGDLEEAIAGQAVTLTLVDEIDISRGDLLADPQARPAHADQFEAKVVWLHDEPLLPGRSYLLKSGAAVVPAQVGKLKHKVNVNTLQQEPGNTLELNEVGVCNLVLGKSIAFDPYHDNRATGSFILIDRLTNATVGAGMIEAVLQHTRNPAELELDRQTRALQKGQRPRVLWLTGRYGSVKSAVARLVEKKLYCLGRHTYVLAEENTEGSAPGLQVAAMAKVLTDAGLIVLVAAETPQQSQRRTARALFAPDEFVEIFLDMPLGAGEQPALDFEVPEAAEITIDGPPVDLDDLAERIIAELYGGVFAPEKLLGAGI